MTSKLCVTTVAIEKVFTPFTMSQVLVVRVLSPPPSHPSLLNSLAILKIYDPRYLSERKPTYAYDGSLLWPLRPWTLDWEMSAAAYREAHLDWWENLDDDNMDDDLSTELDLYKQACDGWTREVEAYRILANSSLSGSTVPIFYDSGDLILDETRAIVPRVLLLEYISDVTDISGLGGTSAITPWHIRTLMAAAVKFNELGITHYDINRGNILISPTRAVIIDFGESTTRIQGGVDKFSDEEWRCQVKEVGDPRGVEKMLTLPDPSSARQLQTRMISNPIEQ